LQSAIKRAIGPNRGQNTGQTVVKLLVKLLVKLRSIPGPSPRGDEGAQKVVKWRSNGGRMAVK
jgi:hypothetical protein